jgi:hypothetical protein
VKYDTLRQIRKNYWQLYFQADPGFWGFSAERLPKHYGDLSRLIENQGAEWPMKKITVPLRRVQPPLASGQLWRMAEADLRVGMVGKLLVHYKLGKPNAVRVPNTCNVIKTVEAYLKANKAVLA